MPSVFISTRRNSAEAAVGISRTISNEQVVGLDAIHRSLLIQPEQVAEVFDAEA